MFSPFLHMPFLPNFWSCKMRKVLLCTNLCQNNQDTRIHASGSKHVADKTKQNQIRSFILLHQGLPNKGHVYLDQNIYDMRICPFPCAICFSGGSMSGTCYSYKLAYPTNAHNICA
jgi:hypothetical protein